VQPYPQKRSREEVPAAAATSSPVLRFGVAKECLHGVFVALNSRHAPFLTGSRDEEIAGDVAAAMRNEPPRFDQPSPGDEDVRDRLDLEVPDDQIPKPPGVRRPSQPFASLLAKVVEHTQQRECLALGSERDRLARVESNTHTIGRRFVPVHGAVDPVTAKPSNQEVRVLGNDPYLGIGDEERDWLVGHPQPAYGQHERAITNPDGQEPSKGAAREPQPRCRLSGRQRRASA